MSEKATTKQARRLDRVSPRSQDGDVPKMATSARTELESGLTTVSTMDPATLTPSPDDCAALLECRICCRGDDADTAGDLKRYCKCFGSCGLMHEQCLLHWLAVSGRNECELCRTPFNVTFGLLKCCWKWRIPSSSEGFLLRWAIFILSLVATFINLCCFTITVYNLWGARHRGNNESDKTISRYLDTLMYFVIMVFPSLGFTIFSAVALRPAAKAFCLSNNRLRLGQRSDSLSDVSTMDGPL